MHKQVRWLSIKHSNEPQTLRKELLKLMRESPTYNSYIQLHS